MAEDFYELQIDGSGSLDDIAGTIDGEEAGGSQFTDNRVGVSHADQTPINIATFKVLSAGQFPKPIAVKKQGDPAPDNSAKFWTGTMLVGGTITAVIAYRSK